MMTGWHGHDDTIRIMYRDLFIIIVMDNSCGSPSALFNVDSCVETKVETTDEISVPKIYCALFQFQRK